MMEMPGEIRRPRPALHEIVRPSDLPERASRVKPRQRRCTYPNGASHPPACGQGDDWPRAAAARHPTCSPAGERPDGGTASASRSGPRGWVETVLRSPRRTRHRARLPGREQPRSVGQGSGHLRNPCLSEHLVQEAEARYGIALPEEYHRFLLLMGNGGAGPDYGVFPLEDCLEHSVDDTRLLREPFPHVQAWNMTPEELGLDPDRDYGAFDKAYFSDAYVQGALKISTEGCAYSTRLVIAGSERGHMWWDGRTTDQGIRPLGGLGFFAEYERWLGRSLGSVT